MHICLMMTGIISVSVSIGFMWMCNHQHLSSAETQETLILRHTFSAVGGVWSLYQPGGF